MAFWWYNRDLVCFGKVYALWYEIFDWYKLCLWYCIYALSMNLRHLYVLMIFTIKWWLNTEEHNEGYRWCLFTNVTVRAMNANGLSWQKTAKHLVFPQFMFHLVASFIWLLKRGMRALVLSQCTFTSWVILCSGHIGLFSNLIACRVSIGVYLLAYLQLQQCWVRVTAWRYTF